MPHGTRVQHFRVSNSSLRLVFWGGVLLFFDIFDTGFGPQTQNIAITRLGPVALLNREKSSPLSRFAWLRSFENEESFVGRASNFYMWEKKIKFGRCV